MCGPLQRNSSLQCLWLGVCPVQEESKHHLPLPKQPCLPPMMVAPQLVVLLLQRLPRLRLEIPRSSLAHHLCHILVLRTLLLLLTTFLPTIHTDMEIKETTPIQVLQVTLLLQHRLCQVHFQLRMDSSSRPVVWVTVTVPHRLRQLVSISCSFHSHSRRRNSNNSTSISNKASVMHIQHRHSRRRPRARVPITQPPVRPTIPQILGIARYQPRQLPQIQREVWLAR